MEKSEYEEEIGRVSVVDALVMRLGDDHALVAAARHVEEASRAAGLELPRAFDGKDTSTEIPVLLANAMMRVQKMLLEIPPPNGTEAHFDPHRTLGQSKLRELDMVLRQATRLSIEVHLFLSGMG